MNIDKCQLGQRAIQTWMDRINFYCFYPVYPVHPCKIFICVYLCSSAARN